MRRRRRIALTVGAAAVSLGIVAGLTELGVATGGPVTRALTSLGGLVRTVEGGLARRLRGPGRAQELDWLEPYRRDAARLRSPDRVLLGAYDGAIPRRLDGVTALEDSLGLALPLIQAYTAWGDRPDQAFPARFVAAVAALGSIPVVTWEPWLTDFENRLHPHLPLRTDRDRGGLAAIARGDYDFYVDAWARAAAEHGGPLLLRFAHEMNDPYRYPWGPHNNRPEDFVAAWRHVVERFRAAGAHNVLWVWAPHVAYQGYEWFWPGEDVVDWTATGALNYGTVANWSEWWSFGEIFGDRYGGLAAWGKPVMIAELGSLAVGGDRVAWHRDALRELPERYPAVRAVLFFQVPDDRTVTYQALDWSFLDDPEVLAVVREAVQGWPREGDGG